MPQSARILVTGGSGYFGTYLCQQLVAQGCEVHNFDLMDYDEPLPSVRVTIGDVRDYAAVRKAASGIDIIHHNVAQVALVNDKQLFESVNITGTENVLRAALEQGVKKVIFVSSSAVYGIPSHNPVDESTPPHPLESYGESKLAGEKLCEEFVERGLDVTIMRPCTILGHGRLGIFQFLFDCIKDNRPVYMLGSGNNTYQFVHAEDLADACIKASLKAGPRAYNIGTDRFGTMRDSLQGLITQVGSQSKLRALPFGPTVLAMNLANWCGLSPLGPYHSLMYGRDLYFDISRARKELAWKPKWGQIELLVDSYRWYVNNYDRIFEDAHARSPHKSPLRLGILNLLKWIP